METDEILELLQSLVNDPRSTVVSKDMILQVLKPGEALKQLKPGDHVMRPMDQAIALSIFEAASNGDEERVKHFTQLSKYHHGIHVGEGQFIDFFPEGVGECNQDDFIGSFHFLFRLDYSKSHLKALAPEETVEIAKKMKEGSKIIYDGLTCEHVATFCKTKKWVQLYPLCGLELTELKVCEPSKRELSGGDISSAWSW